MKPIIVKPYTQRELETWDAFCKNADNTTFMLQRGFMDYHSDLFVDSSLMIYESNTLVAILPAHSIDKICYSHNGLTYGGFIFKTWLKLQKVLKIVAATLKYLNEKGINRLVVKTLPDFYKSNTTQELEYAFFLAKAELKACEAASVINLNSNFNIQSNRLEGLNKAKQHNLRIEEVTDFTLFWNDLLIPLFKKQFNKQPVHSLEEISLLRSRFSENIRQFNVYNSNNIVAGATVFETPTVAHTQYIASDSNRQTFGSLDFLFEWLLKDRYREKHYFSFGTSNFEKGQKLNSGLNYWKESFGARTQVHKTYAIETASHHYITTAL